MKSNSWMCFATSAILLAILSSCGKGGCTIPNDANYDPTATWNNGTCQPSGSVTFWTTSTNYLPVLVTIPPQNGSKVNDTGSISGIYAVLPNGCGLPGCANFNLPTGTYSYTASGTGGFTATGRFTITVGNCTTVREL